MKKFECDKNEVREDLSCDGMTGLPVLLGSNVSKEEVLSETFTFTGHFFLCDILFENFAKNIQKIYGKESVTVAFLPNGLPLMVVKNKAKKTLWQKIKNVILYPITKKKCRKQ
ncbi:MAG: hypothetical protein QME51_00820 [Planctomycetota bacterium]|nr:hypothetical protein [Planctomycetota bacterium]